MKYSFFESFSALLIFCVSLSPAAFSAQIFEIYNKDDQSVKVTATVSGAKFSRTIQDIEIGSKKNLQAEIQEVEVDKFVSIELKIVRSGKVFEFFVTARDRNALLSFDSQKSPPLYPETGKLKGWLGKTESGLSLKNNVESTSIVVFDKAKPSKEQLAQKQTEKEVCNGGPIPTGSLGLQSNEGTCLVADLAVAKQSGTIKNLLMDTEPTAPVPIQSLNEKNLTALFELMKVICNRQGDICDKHVDEAERLKTKLLPKDAIALTGIVGAANYLDVPAILNAGLEQIRELYINKDENAHRQLALALKQNPLPKDLMAQIVPSYFNDPYPKPVATANHSDYVRAIAVSPNGKHWATGSSDGIVKLWKMEPSSDPKPIAAFNGGHTITSLAFSPDGNYLASGSNEGVKLWKAELSGNPQPFATFRSATATSSVRFSPDGRYLADTSPGKVRVWKVEAGSTSTPYREFTGDREGGVPVIAFSPDGKRLAGSKTDKVALYNIEPVGQAPITLFNNSSAVFSLAFSPDGKYLATGLRDAWRLWKNETAANPEPVATFRTVKTVSLQKIIGGSNPVSSVAFSPDGKYLATSSFYDGASLWKPEPATFPSPIATFRLKAKVKEVVFSPNGKYLAASLEDNRLFIYNTDSGKTSEPAAFISGILSPVFSPDGKFLAVRSASLQRAELYRAKKMDVESFTKYLNQLAK